MKIRSLRQKYFSNAGILACTVSTILHAQTASVEQNNHHTQNFVEDRVVIDEESIVEDGIVISKIIPTTQHKTTFAIERYNRRDIANSHATTFYDFLEKQTSLSLSPQYGNPFVRSIDMRGFGDGDGYQNIAIIINGKRLNTIDLLIPSISYIPIEQISSVEILKSSGSVEYGDNSAAGSLIVQTKPKDGILLGGYIGSNDRYYSKGSANIVEKYFSLSVFADSLNDGGRKTITSSGIKDEGSSQNKILSFTLNPHEDLNIRYSRENLKTKYNYANALTLDEFNKNPNTIPSPSWGNEYSKMDSTKNNDSIGFGYDFLDNWNFDFDFYRDKTRLEYVTFKNVAHYENKYLNSKVKYKKNNFDFLFGLDGSNGRRKGFGSDIDKDHFAGFVSSKYQYENHLFNTGFRLHDVTYKHKTNNLEQTDTLKAYEAGYAYILNQNSSLYIGFNQAFQAPDIDRFFDGFGNFNDFIEPMKSKTLSLGYKSSSYPHNYSLNFFNSWIENEIYFDTTKGFWGVNSNIDRSTKKGFELMHQYHFKPNIFSKIHYTYVDAKVDKEGDGSLNGRKMPGVSDHSAKISLGYKPNINSLIMISHNYKSKAYAISDFGGTMGKMKEFHSTDLLASYQYKNINLYAKANNLFEQKNAIFAYNGSSVGVYPSEYQREFLVGIEVKF